MFFEAISAGQLTISIVRRIFWHGFRECVGRTDFKTSFENQIAKPKIFIIRLL
jgi:hypothetical protein